MRDETIREVFGKERSSLVPYVGPLDGVHAVPASVSKTCLVRFDNNRYSDDARAIGPPVEIRAYADRLECWQDGKITGQHERVFGRGKTIHDPLHQLPVLARKPGALRNGAPFREWDLPIAMRRVGRKPERLPGGDRQMVDIPGAVLTDGLEAVEAACAGALANNIHSAGVELNIPARHREPPPPLTVTTPDALKLACEPEANCDRYDSLRRSQDGTHASPGCNGPAQTLRHGAVDSTGIKAGGEGEWNARKHGRAKRRIWRKVHIGIDEQTLEVRAVHCPAGDLRSKSAERGDHRQQYRRCPCCQNCRTGSRVNSRPVP